MLALSHLAPADSNIAMDLDRASHTYLRVCVLKINTILGYKQLTPYDDFAITREDIHTLHAMVITYLHILVCTLVFARLVSQVLSVRP